MCMRDLISSRVSSKPSLGAEELGRSPSYKQLDVQVRLCHPNVFAVKGNRAERVLTVANIGDVAARDGSRLPTFDHLW